MLELRNITKEYVTGDESVHALRGVSVSFRPSEFVAILGPSGCGKTTLLNLIGGLDHYTAGDLVIDGVSTKEYTDGDWDLYRNHRIGFVFQSYNLIPHQTVLANVELALTLSGVSKAERRERAIEALKRVGLGDQLKKKPSQMSGGQMQRVAIARALVNDPQIVLADEPTGALDTNTSEQIMEILKEISHDKLIIMVTHNPDLAERYATRTIRVIDGLVTDDTAPYVPAPKEAEPEGGEGKAEDAPKKKKPAKRNRKEKTSMSFITALSLSLNNLMTKKARTLLTSFAGSIGIIGIALILSLSNGIQAFIDRVQEDTLSSYPLSIESSTMDLSAILESVAGSSTEVEDMEDGYIYPNNQFGQAASGLITSFRQNDLSAFKDYLESEDVNIEEFATLQYQYGVTPMVWRDMEDGSYMAVNPSKAYELLTNFMGNSGSMLGINAWDELLDNQELLENQYELLYGDWPTEYNEVVLIVDANHRLSDLSLYALGIRDYEELERLLGGEVIEPDPNEKYSFRDLVDLELILLLGADCYELRDANDLTKGANDIRLDEARLNTVLEEKGIELKISGIICQSPDAAAVSSSGMIGYTSALTRYIIDATKETEVGQAQMNNPNIDVLTGKYFPSQNKTDDQKKTEMLAYLAAMTEEQKAVWYETNLPSLVLLEIVYDRGMELKEDPRYTDDEEGIANLQADVRKELEANPELLITMMQTMGYDTSKLNESAMKIAVNMIVNQCSDYVFGLEVLATMQAMPNYEAALMQRMTEVAMLGTPAAKAEHLMTHMEGQDALVIATLWDQINPELSSSTYGLNCRVLGIADPETPSRIDIYPKSFSAKEDITALIEAYNADKDDDEKVVYTDYIGIMLKSVAIILDVITYILVGFVAISLVVSSIMIGIITYISVLERIKEIGILRAIGASKRDVSRVFLAESMIVGFGAGVIGILSTLILCIPFNMIIRGLSGFNNLGAELPLAGGIILVIISVVLTLIAGTIPAQIAAKKDPVEALRSE